MLKDYNGQVQWVHIIGEACILTYFIDSITFCRFKKQSRGGTKADFPQSNYADKRQERPVATSSSGGSRLSTYGEAPARK